MNRLQALHRVRSFIGGDRGTTAIEYALIASGIAAAIIAVVMSLGSALYAKYESVSGVL